MECIQAWEPCREMPVVFLHSAVEGHCGQAPGASTRSRPNPRRPGRGGGGCSRRQTNTNKQKTVCVGDDVEHWNPPTPYVCEMGASVENYLAVLPRINTEWPQNPAIVRLHIYSRELKAHLHNNVYEKCSQQWYSLQARREKQTINVDQQNVVYPCNRALFSCKKERGTAPRYSIGKPGTLHAQSKKGDGKAHILYDCILWYV